MMLSSKSFIVGCIVIFVACNSLTHDDLENEQATDNPNIEQNKNPIVSLVVLGTVQDAGSPHMACQKGCCKELFEFPDPKRKVVALGLIDHEEEKTFLFEASPDMITQAKQLKVLANFGASEVPDGIFLTHAHIGHYSGLIYLGKEAMNADKVKVFAMPRMQYFLENNGPWDQLVKLGNIDIQHIQADSLVSLTNNIQVEPFIVPHRDEYSETVGYRIITSHKTVLFIPDIDKWEKWEKNIVEEISSVDYAFIDATFYNANEVNNRDISEIPHPLVIESMNLFDQLSLTEKQKIHFIHFNHTNPLLNDRSEASRYVKSKGYQVPTIDLPLTLK